MTCESLSSTQEENISEDTLIIHFQDPCQFDKVRFRNPGSISDYHIYYVYADTAEALIVNHEFENDLGYCPTICSLTGADN